MKRMKDLLLGGVSGIAIGLAGLAYAQTITSSIQLSQDPRGNIGVDANGGLWLLSGGHLGSNTNNGGNSPTASACGTGPTVTGTDFAFTLTTGSSATSCTVTFAKAFGASPRCILGTQGGATQPTYTTTAASVVITVDVASTAYTGICIGPS